MSGKSINFDVKKMSNLTIKERKSRFNKLSNILNIKPIDIRPIRPIDLSNKNKCMAYCSELTFGILSYSSYIDLEKMAFIFCCRKKMNTSF